MSTTAPLPVRRMKQLSALATLLVLIFAAGLSAGPASAAPIPDDGDTVWIGTGQTGYSGTPLHHLFVDAPADPTNPGAPDFFAYCVEQPLSAMTARLGHVGSLSSFLGTNYFTDPQVQGKVLWVLAHSYPVLDLDAFAAAAGVPGLSQSDAVEATQYAIWRYTDLTFDAAWAWETPDSEAAYWYLVNGANASSGMTPADFETTVSIAAPSGTPTAGSLVGPFTVSTNQATVSVVVEPAIALTDASGAPVDPAAVVDGQELFLDLRSSTSAGTATLTASASGSSATGLVVSVPTSVGGTPTDADHAQTFILATPPTTTTDADASVQWAGLAVPSIGTTLTDAADDDQVLPSTGGVLVDTVAYSGLEVGTSYTVEGVLMDRSTGLATSITGSATFTPTAADGSVEVEFIVPAGFAGRVLVAFETLFVTGDDTVVAEHADLDDAAQTVTVEAVPVAAAQTRDRLTGTGSESNPGLFVLAGVLLALGLAAVTLTRRRSL
jgi:TQXA domain-containing protein/LPXTG-motif cell wall-anchored protein